MLKVFRIEADAGGRAVAQTRWFAAAGVAVAGIDRHRDFREADKVHPDAGLLRVEGVLPAHGARQLAEPAARTAISINR